MTTRTAPSFGASRQAARDDKDRSARSARLGMRGCYCQAERIAPGPSIASPRASGQDVCMPHTEGSPTLVRGAAFGLGAAALFGLSAPIAKRLLADAGPLVLAGLLYTGGGIALAAFGIARRLRGGAPAE